MINSAFLILSIFLASISAQQLPPSLSPPSQVSYTDCAIIQIDGTCICPSDFLPLNSSPPVCISLSSLQASITQTTTTIPPVTDPINIDQNCNNTASNGICISCNDNYFLTNLSTCVRMSSLCNKINPDGSCSECKPGFILSNGLCFSSTSNFHIIDPLCQVINNIGGCIKCSAMSYLDVTGTCRQVSPLCKDYNSTSGSCISCYIGYILTNGQCVIPVEDLDPNCAVFNGNQCINCSKRSFFNSIGKCIQGDVNCKDFYNNGSCQNCYSGFIIDINTRNCVTNPDGNCFQTNYNKCISCSQGYFLNTGGICQLINPFCRTVDTSSIYCTSCYIGYTLYQGNCIDSSKIVIIGGTNTYCTVYDITGQCKQCSQRYYLSNGQCIRVSDQCNTYDPNYGYCTSCYLGYLVNPYGECTINGTY